jgi:hypothetical protein
MSAFIHFSRSKHFVSEADNNFLENPYCNKLAFDFGLKIVSEIHHVPIVIDYNPNLHRRYRTIRNI